MSKTNNKVKGKLGEELAVEYLTKLGLEIIETNWRYSRIGEIDIIAKDKNTLAFIEVKTRSSQVFGHPLEAINNKKMQQIQSVAQIYLHENKKHKAKKYRFDAVAVFLEQPPRIEYFKDVYQF